MGNQHSVSHANLKPRRNVHWKSAGRPAVPGKPEIIPIRQDDEPSAITLRWAPAAHDGGAPLRGYQVECNRLGSSEWIRTSPPLIMRPELVLTGLEPPHSYQFRVAALNAISRSETSELSDVFTIRSDPGYHEAPIFVGHLEDITALENDKTRFHVKFTGAPTPSVAWFKDDYEIFSSRRTVITTTDSSSMLLFHQTLASDEGEIKCTATNRFGHAVTKARLIIEAAPKLRYPRKYEDGLLFEINETVLLKITLVGKPTPTIEWRHDGQPIVPDKRVENTNTCKFSMLKIHSARRSDRGEYQIHARNLIGEDTAAFLVTITAPPDPPQRVVVARQLKKSIVLNWEPPRDDGGCRVCNYIVEYYRSGWNVWLKATTSRQTSTSLFDLIEGSEYRFRVKAENPYGISAPSAESAPVSIPGRPINMTFLPVESPITNNTESRIFPTSLQKRTPSQQDATLPVTASSSLVLTECRQASLSPVRDWPDEFMHVLYQDRKPKAVGKRENCKSLQLNLQEILSPPQLSLSAPDLSSRYVMPFRALRYAVSSTELLQERLIERFYKAVALEKEHARLKVSTNRNNLPHKNRGWETNKQIPAEIIKTPATSESHKAPGIFIKTVSDLYKDYKYSSRHESHDAEASDSKWIVSYDDDYTASTASTDGEYSGEEIDNLNGDVVRHSYDNEDHAYHPRDKVASSSDLSQDTKIEDKWHKQRLSLPLPLLNPNVSLKPILKRKDPDNQESIFVQNSSMARRQDNLKKGEQITLLKKFTKIHSQPFCFPYILKKLESESPDENNTQIMPPQLVKKVEKVEKENMIINDDRTVIDHYSGTVKELGSQKKLLTHFSLSSKEFKTAAKKQQIQMKTQHKNLDQMVIPDKTSRNKGSPATLKEMNFTEKNIHRKTIKNNKTILEKETTKLQQNPIKSIKKGTQQIVLKTTEHVNIVIPIDYRNLEKQAKQRVRSAIDYAVDICLLLLAFWLYLFKDERLAMPLLGLIIYRQIKEALHTLRYTPDWVKANTGWLKHKTS